MTRNKRREEWLTGPATRKVIPKLVCWERGHFETWNPTLRCEFTGKRHELKCKIIRSRVKILDQPWKEEM